MSEYIFDVASQRGKIDWPGALQRSDAFPLDRSSVFSSLEDAQAYITGNADADSRKLGATSYAGQFISVYDDTTKQVYPYLVQFTQNPDGSLKRILTRVLLTGDAISNDPNTNSGSSLDDTSWFIVDGGSAFDAMYRLHNAVCSIRCIDQDTQEVLYTAEPLNGYYFTAYNINSDNIYYIAITDISSVVEKLNWPNSDLYTFVGVNSDETAIINDNYIINGGTITYNYRKTSNIPVIPPDTEDEITTKTASYTVTHCKYSEPVETQTYTTEVPIDSTTLPIVNGSLDSKAGTGDFVGYTLADPILYSNETKIPDGIEVVINYVETGDINRDHVIDDLDMAAWNDYIGRTDEYHPIYDLDADGYITGDDEALLRGLISSNN